MSGDTIDWSKITSSMTVPIKIWKPQNYVCPRHGDIGSVTMHITIQNEKIGTWCLRCYAEMLDQMGVCRVKEAEKSS